MAIDPVIVMDLLAGSFGIIASIVLFLRYYNYRYRSIPALALALCVFIYGLGNFLWAMADLFTGEQPITALLALLAMICNYLPAYFGSLFVIWTIGRKKKELFIIATIITLIGVIGFAIYPLEYELIGNTSVYYLGSELQLVLLPIVLMALSLPIFLLLYGLTMHRAKNRREARKGFFLSFGFLLMVLGEFILVPYFRAPLLADQILLFVGFAFIFSVFLYTELHG